MSDDSGERMDAQQKELEAALADHGFFSSSSFKNVCDELRRRTESAEEKSRLLEQALASQAAVVSTLAQAGYDVSENDR